MHACDTVRRRALVEGSTASGKGQGVAEQRHFGNRLREARLGAGLSQSDLEDISGIPKARLSRYENGHVEPSIQTLNRLARALNVSEASLLGDERAALEEFEAVLKDNGIKLTSKDQARELAEKFVASAKGLAKV
jgi:transcriptional regulator with XRE-family HTH domain